MLLTRSYTASILAALFTSTSAATTTLLRAASNNKNNKNKEHHRRRRLSFDKIVGYEPETQVTDHAAIDLDQQQMEESLGEGSSDGFTRARQVYENGAYSKSYAELTLTTPLTRNFSKGDIVVGRNDANTADIPGKLLKDANSGDTTIQVQYQTTDDQANYVGCQVGALGDDATLFESKANTEGCLSSPSGVVVVTALDSTQVTLEYTYDVQTDNNNGRTLAGFSTQAQAKMLDCQETGGCPYVDYKKFFDYYGRKGDYANQYILAAFTSTSVTMGSYVADFTNIGTEGRIEAIKKGSAYMNVWMYVIREFEDALDDCVEGRITDNDDPVHAWDEGVAFYAGSLEGPAGSDNGVFPYRLAEKRCQNFKTCGSKGDEWVGTSYVNIELLRLFDQGQNDILTGQCAEARKKKERIVEFMTVPLIQGTLRYAYRSAKLPSVDSEKGQLEGSTFAAAVLPVVASCSAKDADTIHQHMKVGGGGAKSYSAVKHAFERNYDCMGISCELVGGLWDDGVEAYYDGAGPCEKSSKNTLAIGLGIGLGAGLMVALLLLFTCRKSSGTTTTDTSKSFSSGVGDERPSITTTPAVQNDDGDKIVA